MSASMNVASILAAFSAGTLTGPVSVSDTASHIDANFDQLQAVAAAGFLGTISLTNGGRPTIAITPAQVTTDAAVLAALKGPYLLAQRTTAANVSTAVLQSPFAAIAVVDTAANIQANLAAIEAEYKTGHLAIVRMTDPFGTVPVFSLSAAQVAANIDVLRTITSPFTINLTDSGTPSIALPIWATQAANIDTVIASIKTPFTLTYAGVIRPGSIASTEIGVDYYSNQNTTGFPADPLSPLGAANPAVLPSGLNIVDYQSNITKYMDSLELAAQAGKLASITTRDGGVQYMGLTTAEMINDAGVVAKFSPNMQASQIITAAQAASPPALAAGFYTYTVQDTQANIMANIAAIGTLGRSGYLARIRFTNTAPDIALSPAQVAQYAYALSFENEENITITLTGGGTPTVTIGGDLMNSGGIRGSVLNRIVGNYNLVVSSPIQASVVASLISENGPDLAALGAGSLVVSDYSTNIVNNLASLQTLAATGRIAAINVIGGGVQTLNLSPSTAAANATALSLITSTPVIATTATATPVALSSAAFTAALTSPAPTLEKQAEAGTLGTVTLTDGGTPVFNTSAANLVANLLAYSKIGSNYSVTLSDAGTPGLTLAPWQVTGSTLSVLSHITGGFTFSISGAITAGQAVTLTSSAVYGKLTGQVAVTDFSNNLSNNQPSNLPALTVLNGPGHLGTVTLLDAGGRMSLTQTEATSNAAVLSAIVSPFSQALVVSAAAAPTTAVPTGNFISMAVQDTQANVLASLSALEPLAVSGKLTAINLTGTITPIAVTAAQFGADADVLRLISNSNGVSFTLTDGGTPNITLQDWQVVNNSSMTTFLNRIAAPYSLTIAGPVQPNVALMLTNASSTVVSSLTPNSLMFRNSAANFQFWNQGAGFIDYMPSLLTLANAGKIQGIDLRAGGVQTFAITAADYVTYAPVFAAMSVPYLPAQILTVAQIPTATLTNGLTTFAVRDSVANVLAGLPQIQSLAASGKLAELLFTDTQPRIVTSASAIMANADAWSVEDYGSYPFILTDAGTPTITLPAYVLNTYSMRNDVLDNIEGSWTLQISGNAQASMMAEIATENNGVLAHLGSPVKVADYSWNVLPYLDQLEYLAKLGKIASISLIDGGLPVLPISAQQAGADADAIALITTPFNVASQVVSQFNTTNGTGELTVDQGGTLQAGIGSTFAPAGLDLSMTSGGVASAVVTGAGSTINNIGQMIIGDSGLASLTINQGGTVATTALIGPSAAAPTLTINNANRLGGAGVSAANVANTGTVAAANGTYEVTGSITGTGFLELDAGGNLQLDRGVASSQTVNFTANNGTLTIENLAAVPALTIAGFTAGDKIALPAQAYVEPSYNATTGVLQLQDNNGNTISTLTFTNKPAAAAVLSSLVLPIGAVIANKAGSDGSGVTVAGTGSSWTIGGELDVGANAAGGLTITGGATVTASQGQIGLAAGGSGNVNLQGAGSTLSFTNDLTVGGSVPGVLTLGNGTTLTVVNNLNVGKFGVINQFGGIIDPNRFPNSGVVGPTGTTIAPLEVENAGTFFAQNGTYSITSQIIDLGTLTGAGTLQIKDGGDLVINAAADSSQTVQFSTSTGTLEVGFVNGVTTNPAIGSFAPSVINGFVAGDTIQVDTLALATFTTTGNSVAVISNGTTLGTLTFASAPGGTIVDKVQCFAAGTRIETANGPTAVEDLREGDIVTTVLGGPGRIVWVGSRTVNCVRHPRPEQVWPVRVSQNAFGPGMPARDLYVSPDHALYVDGVLVPAKSLIDGVKVRQVKRKTVTYHHIELAQHDVVLADGLPAETYLDTGGRTMFEGGSVMALHPDFSAWRWQTEGCAELVLAGPVLDAIRAKLAAPVSAPRRARRRA